MAFDSQLYLRDGAAAASGSLYTGFNTALTNGGVQTPLKLLPGVPLRGLNVQIVVPAAVSTPTLAMALVEAVSTGGGIRALKPIPNITAAGVYNYRFHLSPGYYAVGASLTVTGSSGGGFGAVDIRIGESLGAHGNANPE